MISSSLTNFNEFSVFLQDLEIPKPNSVVGDVECNDVVNEWLTARMMVWRTKRLKCHNHMTPLNFVQE